MSRLYDLAREEFLGGTLSWSSDDVRACLVRSAYTFDAAHTSLADLGANDNGRSAALASKTITAGIADAADTSLTATAANACNALVLFQHSGVDATARLVAYIDTVASGFPLTPGAGQVIAIEWANSANRIFKL